MTLSYDYSDENLTSTRREEYEYDSAGNILWEKTSSTTSYKMDYGDGETGGKEESYSRDTSEATYEYDASGNLIRKSTSSESVYDNSMDANETHNKDRGTMEEEYEYK